MSDSTTSEEQPKRKVAKRVVTPKRKYFFPELGRQYEATDLDAATKLSKRNTKKVEEGDAE